MTAQSDQPATIAKDVPPDLLHMTLISICAPSLRRSSLQGSAHLPTRQHARMIRGWVTPPGLEPGACGTHPMRRTEVARIYRKTENLRAVQPLPGHTKMDSMVRSLGADIEGALTLLEGIDPWLHPQPVRQASAGPVRTYLDQEPPGSRNRYPMPGSVMM